MKEVPQIFLSYAREDRVKVEGLYELLSNAGYKPWMDTKDILAGEQWRLSIDNALRASDFILICLSSQSSNKRGYFQREIKATLDFWKEQLEEDIYIIPVRLDQCDTPRSLGGFQRVDLSERDGWDRLLKALKEGVERRTSPRKPKARQASLFELPMQAVPPPGLGAMALERGAEKVRELESLLGFIEQHKHEEIALAKIPEAIALAEECLSTNPEIVALVFRRLDKLIKRLGNKNLVLEAAELSIKAAESLPKPRKEEIVDAHAQALICGVSWVYQRLGKYSKARAAAEESFELGEKIKSGKNSAFCSKCRGRLYRMEAEISQDKDRREANLRQSIALLEDAIDRFIALYGPMDPEVGDCYSLLGRTYLVAKNFGRAEESIRKAYERIEDRNSKDYFDLVILSGDLEVERGNRRDAAPYYDEALRLPSSKDPEITEMRARAYFQRGRNRAALKERDGAIADFKKAAEIWQSLGETVSADKARWEELSLVEKLTSDASALLSQEEPSVRVAAIQLYKQQNASMGGKRVPQRAKPGRGYWERLIEEAKKQTA